MQRWPAVPNPAKSAPSSARSIFASGITTIGFFPPSSKQALCMYSPVLAPIFLPTSVEPVKPTLFITPSFKPASRAANVCAPSATTVISTSLGTPPAWKISVKALATAGVNSDGFQTTVFPARSAGTMYQDGTAVGKFPAVITNTLPTGILKVNRFLFCISLGTV